MFTLAWKLMIIFWWGVYISCFCPCYLFHTHPDSPNIPLAMKKRADLYCSTIEFMVYYWQMHVCAKCCSHSFLLLIIFWSLIEVICEKGEGEREGLYLIFLQYEFQILISFACNTYKSVENFNWWLREVPKNYWFCICSIYGYDYSF